MKQVVRTVVASTLCLSLGCGGDPEFSEISDETEPSSQPIVNGAAADAPRHRAVAAVLTQKDGAIYLCSAALISGDTLVTAAHCFEDGKDDPSSIRVRFDDFPKTGSGEPDWSAAYADPANHRASAVWVNPDYRAGTLTQDIAMVRLAQPECAIAPVPALTDGSVLTPGRKVNFAGFGLDNYPNEPASDPNTPTSGSKLQVDGVIGGTNNPCDTGNGSFTCLNGNGDQVWYAEERGSGVCSGDSGGPMFVDIGNGDWRLAGVTSYGDENCSVFGVSTRTDAFASQIAAFVAAGQACPMPAPTEPVGDGAGASGEGCADLNR